ncbi:MAG: OsmC family protein [Pseudomonadota bacterium]|uniref:OsmC family protein n=1 Tax=Thermithiobacillus tepidarius TaxID=929 RepID=UPI00040553A9|nr:OsmC family protein [Thermithiobacillus tepidarius]
MKIVLHADTELTLQEGKASGLEVVAENPDVHYGAMQMFATALALCTYSVLVSYAEQIGTDTEALAIRVRWRYAAHPARIDRIDMDITWPELPESRLPAARRAAAHCTLHNTLHQPPEVHTRVRHGPADTPPQSTQE